MNRRISTDKSASGSPIPIVWNCVHYTKQADKRIVADNLAQHVPLVERQAQTRTPISRTRQCSPGALALMTITS